MTTTFESIEEDLRAFADDPDEVIFERASGEVIFVKAGEAITFKLIQEGNDISVEYKGNTIPYKKFLSQTIFDLSLFAQRLANKRENIPGFVNGPAQLESVSSETLEAGALELLNNECTSSLDFATKVVFITADAGHGKTALLTEYQQIQAERYLKGESDFVFWLVDLQGRQLLLLNEALAGDLSELRIQGLWTPGIIQLIRNGLLILAIDGFDELAAEQGTSDALGALANLVQQMNNHGTIIAASRRTFFDTEDYIKRSRILRQRVSKETNFDQIHLQSWGEKEGIEYLTKFEIDGKKFTNPRKTYAELLNTLNGDQNHPLLCRPFLLHKMAAYILRFGVSPGDFVGGLDDPRDGVVSIVRAFVKREVQEKWKTKEEPFESYLTMEEHMTLLAAVAEEMWKEGKERIRTEEVELIASCLLEDWDKSDDRKRQVLEMVKMHALLVVPPGGNSEQRSFEHSEFRAYFVAEALSQKINEALDKESPQIIGQFLQHSSLSDSAARYLSAILEKHDNVPRILELLKQLLAEEWKTTYTQGNVGTLIPHVIDKYELTEQLIFDAPVTYTSLVWENKVITNVTITNGNFINVSFLGTSLKNVKFKNCLFSEVTFDCNPDFTNTEMNDCEFRGIILINNDSEVLREYSKSRTYDILNTWLGISVLDQEIQSTSTIVEMSSLKKVVHRLLRNFRRTTAVSEDNIDYKLKSDKAVIYEVVLPLMIKHNLVSEKTFTDRVRGWTLTKSIEEILSGDGGEGDTELTKFWKAINQMEMA